MLSTINNIFLLSAPSGWEWMWIVVIALVLFGGKKIPELARGLGKGIREFQDAKDGLKSEIENGIKDKKNTKPTATEE